MLHRMHNDLYFFVANIDAKKVDAYAFEGQYFFNMPTGACVIFSEALYEDYLRQRDFGCAG